MNQSFEKYGGYTILVLGTISYFYMISELLSSFKVNWIMIQQLILYCIIFFIQKTLSITKVKLFALIELNVVVYN